MNISSKIHQLLIQALKQASLEAIDFDVEPTGNNKFGDYSSNIAIKLATMTKTKGQLADKRPLEKDKSLPLKIQQTTLGIANRLVEQLIDIDSGHHFFTKIEIAGPGFINFYLSTEFLQNQVKQIVTAKQNYAKNDTGKGKFASVEFVSANPTGPLHIGNARGGPIGDTICNILIHSGYSVQREFYVNDVGGQIEKFGETLLWLSLGSKFVSQKIKENRTDDAEVELYYKGKYMMKLAAATKDDVLSDHKMSELQKMDLKRLSTLFGQTGAKIQVKEILSDLKSIGIDYDKVYYESFFLEQKSIQTVELLKKKGLAVEKEGALWFLPKGLKANFTDRESVLIKSNGELTYFANDIAYHKHKFESNPGLVVNVLGGGHHGHVPRIKAAIAALGYDPNKYFVVLYQNVAIKEGSKKVKMSKREGIFVTAADVVSQVGKDAFRFFMLMYDPGTHLDFDLELAKKKNVDNPVYYVQYAHARISSILAKSKQKNEAFDLSVLTHQAELALIKGLIKLPGLVENLSTNFAVHQLTYYAIEIADLFHRFYEQCRVISDDKRLTLARLQLTAATGIIIRTTLSLLEVSAPEKM